MTSTDLYALADLVASRLLESKTDKQGQPLIEHCRRVHTRCIEMGLSEAQCIAGLLHDCIEDGQLPYLESQIHPAIEKVIHALFGHQVWLIVLALTRHPSLVYKAYIEMIPKLCPAAIPVKLADLSDNLDLSRGPIPDSLRTRYEWAKTYLESTLKGGPK